MSSFRTIDSEAKGKERLLEFAAQDRKQETDDKANKAENRNFVQVYPKGWQRLRKLILINPSAARVYAFLAEHCEAPIGAVVVSQDVIASQLGVHKRTIIRLTKQLEEENAIVRIRVGTGVYAYCLDPEEIWRSYNDAKDMAAFTTRTLVKKSDRSNGNVNRKLRVMVGEPVLKKNEEE